MQEEGEKVRTCMCMREREREREREGEREREEEGGRETGHGNCEGKNWPARSAAFMW